MTFRSLALAALAAFGICLPAASQQPPRAAESPVYHVEMIVFRATTALGGAENWSAQAGARLPAHPAEEAADAASEAAPAGPPSSSGASRLVARLPASQFQLRELAGKLRASGAYEPVAHVAWAQTASPWGTRSGIPIAQLGIAAPGLTGSVYLERGQYLHFGMTLNYAMPDPPAGIGAGPGTTFVLDEIRRVRFYERHYYDHPAFGVIALVTPAKSERPPGR